jgi:hypothetical protein
LGDHRVVERAHGIAFAEAGVHARAGLVALEAHVLGPAHHLQRTGGRQEVAVGVLGADAGLDCVAPHRDLLLRQRQAFAGGDAQLPFDQVQPGHGLGHRVLDLQPGCSSP